MRFRLLVLPFTWLFLTLLPPTAAAPVFNQTDRALPFLSPIFGDHMVLQRGEPNRFWGWTQPGQRVTVNVEGRTADATAGPDGRWSVPIEVPAVGGPYAVSVSGPQTVTLHDVLVGDVWLCGGQSNMYFPLRDSARGAEEVAAAHQADLRLCDVEIRNAYRPALVPSCAWQECAPESAAGFSAVAYYFARRLQAELHIPIGLIEACSGGSPAEAWMTAESLEKIGEFAPQLAEIRRLSALDVRPYGSFLMHWLDQYDVGGRDGAWAKADLDDSRWTPVHLPGGFAELGVVATPCVCWFRREINLPANLPVEPAKIFLGEVEKMDTTYINGRWVGASSWVEHPRVYLIPAGTLKPGRNVVAVRVFKTKPDGGFRSGAGALRLELADGTSVALAGRWQGRLSIDARPPHPWPLDLENYATMPTTLGNGMIAPLVPLALTGAIWYQGEANTTRVEQYRKLLPTLIQDWRAQFGQGEFPFYIVSLPAFMARRPEPGSDGWAALREVQAQTVQSVPNTGLAVTIDTGDAGNIHPTDKKTVGDRLALCALARHYRRPVVDSGPTFASMEKLPGGLRLHFANLAGGLVVQGERLGEFAVAGADRKWHWAQARIDGDSVIVSAPEVPAPVAARYAWQGNPLATLFNTAGLPAAPFRTDDWPLDSGR